MIHPCHIPQYVCVCVCQVESETAISELKLSNTTGRLVQLEREVGLLRQNNLEVNSMVETADWITNQAKLNAEEAQQVSHTHTHPSLFLTFNNLHLNFRQQFSISLIRKTQNASIRCRHPSKSCLFV